MSASREGLRSAWLSARVKTRVCWPDPVSRQLDLGRYTSDKQTKKNKFVLYSTTKNDFTTVRLPLPSYPALLK